MHCSIGSVGMPEDIWPLIVLHMGLADGVLPPGGCMCNMINFSKGCLQQLQGHCPATCKA